jgi:hypothetical protein
MNTLYQHPEGGAIWFNGTHLGITQPFDDDSGEEVAAIHIGPAGLKALGYKLLALAAELEASSA